MPLGNNRDAGLPLGRNREGENMGNVCTYSKVGLNRFAR